jgi:XTP/dITP diphosphohydrolase
MTLLVATTNPGKIREIRLALRGAPVELRTLADVGPVPEPEETGSTFAANAAHKARYYAARAGLPTVAEDSGLVIDALGGAPGVRSARYPGKTYAEKFDNLYRALAPHPRPWIARFVCSLAYVEGPASVTVAPRHQTPPAVAFSCEGTIEGDIAPGPRGANGFGYDPIFFYPPYGTTLGEVTDDDKLAVSHRGRAFQLFRAWISAKSDSTSRF